MISFNNKPFINQGVSLATENCKQTFQLRTVHQSGICHKLNRRTHIELAAVRIENFHVSNQEERKRTHEKGAVKSLKDEEEWLLSHSKIRKK